MDDSVARIRLEYTLQQLNETDVDPDPVEEFAKWLDAAIQAKIHEPNAMTLATVSPEGKPSARVVLLRAVDERGFTFYTNFESRKSREMAADPWAALTFWWGPLERQIRIEGRVERVDDATSDAYFASRPRGSQLGAWASAQSRVIGSRMILEERLRDLMEKYEGKEIPRPSFWGGFRVVPETLEFWQGRPSRLHDRLRYRLVDGAWVIERLAP